MKNKLYRLTKVSIICASFFCFCGVAEPQSASIDRLLILASSYKQVEKTITLLKPPTSVITRIPCISPLYPNDLYQISISSTYGRRLHPLLHEYKHHSGIDLPGNMGEPVHATADGVIIETGKNSMIGMFVRIRHAYGFSSLYGHLSKIEIEKDDTVRIGRVIGKVGSTGRSTGPHLHYGISKNGREQDPQPYCYLYLKWRMMSIREGKK